MIYEGVVYFAGGMTLWGGKVADKEIIFRASSSLLWVTRLLVLSAYGPLDHERCGYVIKQGDKIVACAKAAGEAVPA